VILTGTPLQNNLRELWAMLHYLAPDVFTSHCAALFEEGFDLSKGLIDSNILRQARKLLSLFMLRRIKDNVALKLPSRRELTILVPLTSQQIELYKQVLCSLDSDTIETVMRVSDETTNRENDLLADDSKALTRNNDPLPVAAISDNHDWRKLMNLLLQLRKICNHTYLMPEIEPNPYEITEQIVLGSGKLLMLDRMLPKLRADGHRVLLFSQFTSMLDILEDYCELRDYPFVRLDGETNRVRRRLDVRRFNAANSSLFIFLISTRAGGLGLNLASADTVILYDSDWYLQCL
jgi:SWI/SNF-related matrix-associated actin-dependent regulator of chromatin subfamily A member 5